MKISIIGGTGYVGLITGLGLAINGHDVICMDGDSKKLNKLINGITSTLAPALAAHV